MLCEVSFLSLGKTSITYKFIIPYFTYICKLLPKKNKLKSAIFSAFYTIVYFVFAKFITIKFYLLWNIMRIFYYHNSIYFFNRTRIWENWHVFEFFSSTYSIIIFWRSKCRLNAHKYLYKLFPCFN